MSTSVSAGSSKSSSTPGCPGRCAFVLDYGGQFGVRWQNCRDTGNTQDCDDVEIEGCDNLFCRCDLGTAGGASSGDLTNGITLGALVPGVWGIFIQPGGGGFQYSLRVYVRQPTPEDLGYVEFSISPLPAGFKVSAQCGELAPVPDVDILEQTFPPPDFGSDSGSEGEP
jgi:hypothetical protein